MPVLSWVRALFGNKPTKPIRNARKSRRRTPLDVEALESRLTPSTAPSATLQLINTSASGVSTTAATLNLDSYSFGFANNLTIGSASSGAGAGKATFNDLTVTTPLSGNSPKLFKTLAAGGSFSQAYLTQNDATGKPIAVWTLKPVYLDSDKVDGDGSVIPEETFQFKFHAVTEATKVNTQSWDQVANASGTPAPPPPGQTLADIPTPTTTDAKLELFTGNGSDPAAFELKDFSFSVDNPTTIGSATTGAGGGKTKFNEFQITKDLSADSPKLLATLTTGTHYDHALLIQYNAAGQPEVAWTMKLVFISSDEVDGQAGSLPTEKVHFKFGAITESVQTKPTGGPVTSVSWDQVLHSTGTPSLLPPDINLVTIPVPTAPPITLTLTPSSGDKTPITIALSSYLFNVTKPVSIGSQSSGAGQGKVKFDELIVDAGFSKGSLALFQTITTGAHFDNAVLTQNDANGQLLESWTLSKVYATSEAISNQDGSGGPTEEVHLAYTAETEATGGSSSGWNQVTNKGTFTDTPPIGVVPDSSLPAPVTLQLTPATGNTTPFTIPVQSFQLGFDKPVIVGSPTSGISTGKGRFEDLIIKADFGSYSPKLFNATAAGTRFGTAVLTQNDAMGIPVAVWTFNVVFASSDSISGTAGELPQETIHFVFSSETEATKNQIASFDITRNQAGTPGANPNGAALDAIPPLGTSIVTLQLTPATGAPGQPVTIPLNNYQFGFTNNAPLGWSGATPTKTKLNELDVTTLFGADSPQLFSTLVTGGHFSTATLTQQDGAGHVIAVWTLNTVYITQDQLSGDGGEMPTESLHFIFRGITERTNTSSAAWDQVTNVGPTPAPVPQGVTIAPITPPTGPSITLELIPRGKTPTPITIAVNDYDFLFDKPLTLTSSASGAKGGKTTLDGLTVDAFFGNDSPTILALLAKGDHYASAVLVQRNAAGQPIASWTLNTVFVTADTIKGDVEGRPVETLKFAFNGINETTAAATNSWDQVHNLAGTFATLFDQNKLVSIDGSSPPIAG